MMNGGSSVWESASEDFLIRILRTHSEHSVVAALSAVFESSGLAAIATELTELVGYLSRKEGPSHD
jgi:DNA-binding phage protein